MYTALLLVSSVIVTREVSIEILFLFCFFVLFCLFWLSRPSLSSLLSFLFHSLLSFHSSSFFSFYYFLFIIFLFFSLFFLFTFHFSSRITLTFPVFVFFSIFFSYSLLFYFLFIYQAFLPGISSLLLSSRSFSVIHSTLSFILPQYFWPSSVIFFLFVFQFHFLHTHQKWF